jgi:histidinol-phosphatase
MTPAELDRALAVAVEAARAAGEVALKYYRTGFDVTLKADATPVTQADRGAEQAIRDVLVDAFPDVGFLGEEFGAVGDQQRRWIIDPIDGTKNFIRRLPVWATLIGLEERGEITVGVIHNPVTGELLSARRGGGAYAGGERIAVSAVADLGRATLLHAGLRLLREAGCCLKAWDLAPCKIIVEEAGGRFTDFAGRPTIHSGNAFATNGLLHETALALFRR